MGAKVCTGTYEWGCDSVFVVVLFVSGDPALSAVGAAAA